MSYKLPFFVKKYFDLMDTYPHQFCKDQWALRNNVVIPAFENENLFFDEELAIKYFGLAKYLPFEHTFEWEEFVLGLHLCTFIVSTGMPRWPDLFCLIGRGAGKDGVISLESMALISPYNKIKEYDVDICANNEEQAKRPVKDLVVAFDSNLIKMKKYFYWTQEIIRGNKRNSYVKGHTNNAKGKDGLRSGCVIFNEYHAYENYENVNVFTTGLGKKKHPRRSIYTTNGDVVDGPLDELIKDSEDILYNGAPDNGLLPFLCRLDDKKEVHDEEMWHKANPSLRYRESLLIEIRKEYREWKKNPARLPAFMTKRMNIRDTQNELAVTSWENIEATNKDVPDLSGWECVVGIDFSKITDWAAINFHFKKGEDRFDINHAFICLRSSELHRLRCPYRDWATKGYITLIDDVEISPAYICDYIYQMSRKYRIKKIAMDSFRYDLLRNNLFNIGFDVEKKNIVMLRPSDIMKVYPMIDRCFSNQFFHWGEQPCLRWATNNTKLVRAKKSSLAINGEADTGNFMFAKIEGKARKTDPFMALVASMCIEKELKDYAAPSANRRNIGVSVF